MTSASYDRTDVFISYSHEDAKYLERLRKHLTPYERSGSLRVWEDTRLSPGSQWRVEIEEAIKKTRIAILLVSADFLASKFIAENELPPLLAAAKTEGTIVIPVILSACAFKDTALSQFQGVTSSSKPLSGMSRNEKEKIWAEIATIVNMELSKASEHKPDSTDAMSSAIMKLPKASEHKPDSTDAMSSSDVQKITSAFALVVSGSHVVVLSEKFKDDTIFDYAIIDIGTGQKWLTSRLYIFAIMLERMRGLRCFVFLETRAEVDQRFLGIASPREVRWTLARRYPWLERAFAKAYFSISTKSKSNRWLPHFSILSAIGALEPDLAQQLVYYFLGDPNIQQTLPLGKLPSPDDSNWESLATKDGQQLWEHAKWTRPQQDLGEIIQQDESTWVIESPDISHTELARSILRCKSPFVALVDKEKRFKSLIDRQDLLERTVAHQ